MGGERERDAEEGGGEENWKMEKKESVLSFPFLSAGAQESPPLLFFVFAFSVFFFLSFCFFFFSHLLNTETQGRVSRARSQGGRSGTEEEEGGGGDENDELAPPPLSPPPFASHCATKASAAASKVGVSLSSAAAAVAVGSQST